VAVLCPKMIRRTTCGNQINGHRQPYERQQQSYRDMTSRVRRRFDSIATPARLTFKMVWKSAGEPVKYNDASRHFRFTGTRASPCGISSHNRMRVEKSCAGLAFRNGPSLKHARLWDDSCLVAYRLPIGTQAPQREPVNSTPLIEGHRGLEIRRPRARWGQLPSSTSYRRNGLLASGHASIPMG
jgi:hypothetical protein